MRLIIYSLAVLAACVVTGLIVAHRTGVANEEAQALETRASVERLRQEIHIRRALETAELNEMHWPKRPDPAWFGETVPANELLDRNRPWLEIAPASQAALSHPPNRVASNESVAAFWYNPYSGIVRARAPKRMTDRKSLEIYNEINAAEVASLLDISWLALDDLRNEPVTRAEPLAATNAGYPTDDVYDDGDDALSDAETTREDAVAPR